MKGLYSQVSGSRQSSGHSGVSTTTNSFWDCISQTLRKWRLPFCMGLSPTCAARVRFLSLTSAFAHNLISWCRNLWLT